MFCYQCEQTAGGTGCTKVGVCGKNEDIASLQDTLVFALKGIAAYAYHARELGAHDEEVDAFFSEGLFATLTNVNFNLESHIELLLKAGKMNLRVMELLDKAHVERFGVPQPTKVQVGTKAGPGILVTGHDLLDLYELLKQTQGTGINVYTHGEMLPAHGYPELRKFPHLVGNYGTAWQNQRQEFEEFSGAILATTNCVLIPKDSYKDRMFTSGVANLPGVPHIKDRNFQPLIEKALTLPPLPENPGPTTMTGFHHQAVLALADKIIEAVKAGKIRHFFLVGGCDGAKPGRNYYTEFVEKVPKDCVVLTLGCGKYRFNYLDLGEIDGIPRLLDMGQCNNAYSAIQVATALAKAFGCSVNELPLSLVLSWFEQKAVAILLTLLHLGIKNIRLGPSLPAFLTPNVLKVLQENYNIQPITTPEADIKAILG
ncbi:MAG: hydroxylamine reductase [Bacillota bacterium]|jgi:hydroxylamine reductase|nr:hydroxylamine reductase [Bacillota bacterium]MDK2925389.1 hydroxylamine reductase [Bacillota bacterium]